MLLLGDSIPKYITEIRGLKNHCLRRANIGKIADFLTFMVPEDRVKLQARVNILHVGTNNVVPGSSAIQIARSYQVLLDFLKFYFPDATLLCSAILPRPCDTVVTAYVTKLLNKLFCITADRNGCAFIKSFKPFITGTQIRQDLFAKDQLDLNGLGQFALTACFRQCLAVKNLRSVRTRTQILAKRWAATLIASHYPTQWYWVSFYICPVESSFAHQHFSSRSPFFGILQSSSGVRLTTHRILCLKHSLGNQSWTLGEAISVNPCREVSRWKKQGPAGGLGVTSPSLSRESGFFVLVESRH